jgi:hypothetical protein
MSVIKKSVLGLALAMTGLMAAAPAEAQNYRGGYDRSYGYQNNGYHTNSDHDRNWQWQRERDRERARRWHRHHDRRDYGHDRRDYRDYRGNDRDNHRGY